MWQYLKSREFWLTILGVILLGVIVYFIFFYIFLPSYTRHGETVIVPEVTKMRVEEAASTLDTVGLGFEVSDSLYIADLPPRAVISQDPSGLSKVKPGRRIYLTVNKAKPPMVKFPEVLFVSNYQAKLRLESWNLNIGKIIYKPHEYKNLVLKAEVDGKEIKAGDSVAVGTKIILTVGKGKGSQLVEIPKLEGETYESAVSLIHEVGLNIGALRFMPEEDPPGMIIKQNPSYIRGDSMRMGSEINLIISGPEPAEMQDEGLKLEDIINDKNGSQPPSGPPDDPDEG